MFRHRIPETSISRSARAVSLYLAVLVLLIAGLGSVDAFASTTYYVSNEGDDNHPGTSSADPWQSIARVNAATFEPGDAVLFRRGDIWHESLVISWSGTETAPITFSSYGPGPKPRISGSVRLSDWNHVSGPIWVSVEETEDPSRGAPHDGSQSGSGGYPGGAWFEAPDGTVTWGRQEAYIDHAGDFSELTEHLDWGWFDHHIYVYATTDPSSAFGALHASQRQYAVGMPNNDPQEHIVIEDLELVFTQSKGFFAGYPAREAHDLVIRDCHVAYIGIKGAASAYGLAVWHSDMLVQGNEIHDCGRRSVSYNVYATRNVLFENVTFDGNHFHHGFHTTGLDISNSGTDQFHDFVVSNNLFEGDPTVDLGAAGAFNSNHIWTHTNPGGALADFAFFNNIFTFHHGKGLTINGITNAFVAFNTFSGVNPTLTNYQAQLYFSNTVTNATVRNNIFVNDVDPSFNQYFLCVKADVEHIGEIDMDHNLFFTVSPNAFFADVVGIAGSYQMHEWSEYLSDTGWDGSSPPPQQPGFVNGPAGDLHLAPGSAAIGAGESIPWITTDLDGVPRADPPSLGAYAAGATGLLFADGFERGDLRHWSIQSL